MACDRPRSDPSRVRTASGLFLVASVILVPVLERGDGRQGDVEETATFTGSGPIFSAGQSERADVERA